MSRSPTHTPTKMSEHADPTPLRLSDLLRELQATAKLERGLRLSLDLDETIHVQAPKLLLVWVLESLLSTALTTARPASPVVLGCRAEENGVAIELEYELDDGWLRERSRERVHDAQWLRIAVSEIPGALSDDIDFGQRLLRLTLPQNLRRTYAPPLLET